MKAVLMKYCSFIIALLTATDSFSQAKDPVAENMLIYQRNVGGWPKHINNVKVDYSKELSEGEKAGIVDDKFRNDATIDNYATTKEIRYLVSSYKKTGNPGYKAAAEKGIKYLLIMQHPNGGWPQFYPDTSMYRNQVTYNDNAMINALNVLWDVVHRENGFDLIDPSFILPSKEAIKKGIDCILKTQVTVNGKLTGWCAQYDEVTLKPAKARAYELPSISGMESVGIVNFLMKQPNPSEQMKASIESAIQWFESSKIRGYKYIDIEDPSQPKRKDRVLVPDSNSVVWARFYDISSNKPFFSGRDGSKKWLLTEVEVERRTGYGWYGTWPLDLLEKEYPEWKKRNK